MSIISAQQLPRITDDEIARIYQSGLKAHQGGDFNTAQQQYHTVLTHNPAHIKTLYLLGSLYCQTNQFVQGIEYLDKTIFLSPEHAEAHSSRGNALNQLQNFDEALKCYVTATDINPEYADAYHNQGITLVNLNRSKEAIASFEEAIRLKPDFAMAYFEKGNIELTLNYYLPAINSFKQVLALLPDYADAVTHLRYAENALAKSKLKGSESHSATNLDLSTETLNNLLSQGEKLEKLNLIKLALDYYQEAIKRYPKTVKAHIRLGIVLRQENRIAEALTCFNTAIKLNPRSALAFQKRGEIYTRTNLLHEAIADYKVALGIDGDYYQYYYSIAFAYRCLGLLDDALENYRLWFRLFDGKRNKKDCATADFSESIIWLLKGHYQLGWQLYEGRWLAVASKNFRHFKQPLWLGDSDISDKHILLHAEQGFGDTLQMFRYVELVASKAAKVTLEINAPLLRLLKNNTNVDVISKDDAHPNFDVQCPLMSLPLAFKTTLDTIPAVKTAFSADDETKAIWLKKVNEKLSNLTTAPKVGFVATGNIKHSGDIARSLTFEQVVAFIPQHVHLFCLQKEFRSDNAKFLDSNKQIHYFGKQLMDFADTAALIECMDLVITVDTSVAHLAASMGKPTWILLPFANDFRWLLKRSDSPWYPTAKLYRQTVLGDWGNVLESLKADLNNIKPI